MNFRRNRILVWLLGAAMLSAVRSDAQPVTKISGGGWHSLFLKSDGSLWGMGYNADGEFGDGTTNNASLPRGIVSSNVTAIAAGGYHSLLLKSDGSLWVMGYNGSGELGDGTFDSTNQPEEIISSNVTAIAAGQFHSLFIKSDGSLWAVGDGGNGELGDGNYFTNDPYYGTNQPERIVSSNVTAIAAGGYHSLLLKSDGSLWAMGYNGYGELGDGTTDGGNYETNRPEQIVSSNVTAIAAGFYFSLFLKSDGSLWAMGDNEYGELGDGTSGQNNFTNRPKQIVASNVTAIAAGQYHSLFLKRDGSLWAMGDNANGQLGDGTYGGTNGFISWPEQIVPGGVVAIAAGYYHSLFLKNDGSLWGMGYNGDGELGDGTYDTAPNYGPSSPVQILAAYNRISGQLLTSGKMQLSFVGIAGANYALDRSTSLSPPGWIPQTTNPAGSVGTLVLTNTLDTAANNFWRIRLVP